MAGPQENKYLIIAVDFDQTLHHKTFPDFGLPDYALIKALNIMKSKGHKIILWTCRDGKPLEQAVEFCEKNGLQFDAVNDNVEEMKGRPYGNKKIYADIYIDDRNLHIDEFINKVIEELDNGRTSKA